MGKIGPGSLCQQQRPFPGGKCAHEMDRQNKWLSLPCEIERAEGDVLWRENGEASGQWPERPVTSSQNLFF